MSRGINEEGNVSEDATGAASDSDDGGLVGRLQRRGQELAKGRRVAIPLPGWDGFDGTERRLFARFVPLNRSMQQRYAWSGDASKQEVEVIAPILASACEEILVGTYEERTALADEPGVQQAREGGGPLRFDADLGRILGVGGSTPEAVVKRVLVRGDDDLPLYGVWAELMSWSTSVFAAGVETAAGE